MGCKKIIIFFLIACIFLNITSYVISGVEKITERATLELIQPSPSVQKVQVPKNQIFEVKVKVSCLEEDCDDVAVGLDPEASLVWNKTISKSGKDTKSGNIAIDSEGKIYIVGYVEASYLKNKILLQKYDKNGNLIWEKTSSETYPGNIVYSNKIALDSSNNIYIVDYLYLNKYDSSGNLIWEKNVGGRNILIDSSNDIYITIPGEGSPFSINKYDSKGNLIWSKSKRTGGNNYPYALALDSSGNIYVGGLSLFPSAYFLLKYDKDGNLIWESTKINETFYHPITDLAIDSTGNIYSVGIKLIGRNKTLLIMKFSPDGELIWDKTIEGADGEEPKMTSSET